MKDRSQKSDALRYIVARRWFPQLEVNVLPRTATSKADYLITDIDVLGSIPDEFDGYRTLLIDCKTGKEKPISRALWLRGLMDRLEGARGICIFKRNSVERDHRLVAADCNVLLFTETEFQTFVKATNGILNSENSHLAEIENWEHYFEIENRYQKLQTCIHFSRSEFWMCKTEAAACRKTIATLIEVKPELDPTRPEHIAIVGDYVALFLHALARIVLKIFSSYLQPENRDDLADALLFILYGGRESYEFANKLRKMIPSRDHEKMENLTPPEWDRFVQLTRQTLDAPTQALVAPLIAREIAWSYLGSTQSTAFAKILAAQSPYAGKFCLLGTEYLSKAAKLPPEFGEILMNQFLQIQRPPSAD